MGNKGDILQRSRLQQGEKGQTGLERRYQKQYSKIEVRQGKQVIRVRSGTDWNGVRTGSDNAISLSDF